VGPAGKLLRAAIPEAGIAVEAVFLTNVVKHFGWEPRGKRRIHKTPAQKHIGACCVWLDAEIARVRPDVIVALGATAIHALSGARLRVGRTRHAHLASIRRARGRDLPSFRCLASSG